jgi:hypothetical protein
MNYFDIWEKSLKERENTIKDFKENVTLKDKIYKLE